MTQSEAEPMFPIPAVYLIHGKGDSTNAPVNKLQAVLEQHWPGLNFIRPDLPFHDPRSPADVAVKELLRIEIPEGSLLVGLGLGGLVAARLQELGRQDLQVIAIGSPTWADEVALESGQRGDLRSIRLMTRSSRQESRIGRGSRAFRMTYTGLTKKQTNISNTSPGCSIGMWRELCRSGFMKFENPPRRNRSAMKLCGT